MLIFVSIVGHLSNLNADYLELPFNGADGKDPITMFIYLPCNKTSKSADELLANMDYDAIQVAFTSDTPQQVHVELPQMNLVKDYKLRPVSLHF